MSDYYISTTKPLLDTKKIWRLLRTCIWSKEIPIEYVHRLIEHSLCFGIYQNKTNELQGFGRIITDYTTYAYICDIIIDPEHRQKGLATALVAAMIKYPELQGLKTWSLRCTEEARKIYEKIGFKIAQSPETILEMNDIEIYCRPSFVNIHENPQDAMISID